MLDNELMKNKSTKDTLQKSKQTDRQKRLSMALRENLRKRKAQTQEREKIHENLPPYGPTE